MIDSSRNLVEAVNEEVPEADLESEDVEPDWYKFVRKEDDAMFDRGHPPQADD